MRINTTNTITMKLKILGMTLCMVLGVGLIFAPTAVQAASTCSDLQMTGDGTSENPCLVDTCEQLFLLGSNADAAALDLAYRLTQDIVCPGDMSTVPIGTSSVPFTGTFNGGGNTINYLVVNSSNTDNIGMFGYVYNASISNLTLSVANVDDGAANVGALAGTVAGSSIIKNVRVELSNISGNNSVGGLVGLLTGTSQISYSTVVATNVSADADVAGGLVGMVTGNVRVAISKSSSSNIVTVSSLSSTGGLVGYLSNGSLSNVYAKASVIEQGNGQSGGLVGVMINATIHNAFAAGSISSTTGPASGGLVGLVLGAGNSIENSFASVDGNGVYGFYGDSDGGTPTLLNNYYDGSSVNNNVCHSQSDGDELGCTKANTVNVGYWRDSSNQPMASWNSFDTWHLTNSGVKYPFLFAEGSIAPAPFDGGDGDLETPFLISNCRQLQHMRDNLGAYYKLNTVTVDCAETVNWFDGKGFDPIGSNTGAFTGNFDGNGHAISNMTINRPGSDYVGLFGNAGGAGVVYNLRFDDISIIGKNYVGGVAGKNSGASIYEVGITGKVRGVTMVGGVVGKNDGFIWDIYSHAAIEGVAGSGVGGGLVGENGGFIFSSYSTGSVPGGSGKGGIIGYDLDSGGSPGTFWDTDTSGIAVSSGDGVGKTTAELKNVATFTTGPITAWDFVGNPNGDTADDDIWNINPLINQGYPYLTAQYQVGPSVPLADLPSIPTINGEAGGATSAPKSNSRRDVVLMQESIPITSQDVITGDDTTEHGSQNAVVQDSASNKDTQKTEATSVTLTPWTIGGFSLLILVIVGYVLYRRLRTAA